MRNLVTVESFRPWMVALALVVMTAGMVAAQEAPCGVYDSGEPIPTDASGDCPGRAPAAPAAPAAPGSLTTLFASDNQFAGNTFDLVADKPMVITGFDVNLATGTTTTIDVYYRMGTANGAESSSAGWVLMGSDTSVTPAGQDVPTPVDVGGLVLEPGQVYGIYVDVASYPSASLRYTNGGPTTFSNADLELTTYVGKGNPAFTGLNFEYRQWNGTVYYDTQLENVPTLSSLGVLALALLLAGAAVVVLRRAF